MKGSEYHLQNVNRRTDGREGSVGVYAVSASDAANVVARRSFLGAGVAAASVAAAITPAASAAPPTPVASKAVFAHIGPVRALRFSPDGKRLASGSDDGTAKVWNLDGGEPLFVGAHPDDVRDVAFVGDSLATGCKDNEVRVWSLRGDSSVKRCSGHKKPIIGLQHIDSRTFLSADSRGVVKRWKSTREAGSWTLPMRIANIAYSPSNDQVVAAEQAKKLRIYSLANARTVTEFIANDPRTSVVAVSSTAQLIATGGAKGDVSIRSLTRPTDAGKVAQHEGRALVLAFSPDGSTLVSSGPKSMIISSPAEMDSHTIPTAFPVMSLAISPDGNVLAAGDSQGVITLWSLRRRELIGFIVDAKVSDDDVILYRTKQVWTDRFLVFGLPGSFPVPKGAERVAALVHDDGKSTRPLRRRKSARERLNEIVVARAKLRQIKLEKQWRKRQMALAYYQWYQQQLYQYNYHKYGYESSSTRTVCVCNTISY